jgi:hypothetical protein
MNLKKAVAAILLMAAFLQTSQAFATNTNPHHYLWIALQNGVRLDYDGENTYRKARRLGFEKPLFHCFVTERISNSICNEDFYIKPYRVGSERDPYLYIHANFMSESFDEKVRIVKEALEAYVQENALR